MKQPAMAPVSAARDHAAALLHTLREDDFRIVHRVIRVLAGSAA